MTGEFHDDFRRDSQAQRRDHERAPCGVCRYQFIFREHVFMAHVAGEPYDAHRFIDAAFLTQRFQVNVHLDIGDYRQRQIVLERLVTVFVEDGT